MDKFVLFSSMQSVDEVLAKILPTEQITVLVECLAAKSVLHRRDEITIDECICTLQDYLKEQILAYEKTKQKLEGRE